MVDFLGSSHYPLALAEPFRDLIEQTVPLVGRDAAIDEVRKSTLIPSFGYRPLPQAVRFHKSRARFRYALGGNRSSKSHALVHEIFWRLMGTHPWTPCKSGILAWYATKTFELVGAALWPKMESLLKGYDYSISWISKSDNIPRTVTIPLEGNKISRLTYKAYEQGRETFQATELDEAAFDEQFPRDVYLETISRLGAERNLNFSAAMTPIDPMPWLEEKLTSIPLPANTEVFEFPLDDNRVSLGGFIGDQEIDAVIEEWPPEVRATRRSGKWGSYVGTIFQTFNRSVHVVKPEDEHKFLLAGEGDTRWLPQQLLAKGAIDWGGANPFVFIWGVQLPHLDGAWYIFDEYYWESRIQGQRRLEQHADEIKDRTRDRWKTALERIWADHDPTDVYEFEGYGLPSEPANKDVSLGIESLQTLFAIRKDTGRPRLYIAQRCVKTTQQMSTYKYPEGSDSKDPLNKPVKKDDHTVDAARYLIHSEKEYVPSSGKKRNLGSGSKRVF